MGGEGMVLLKWAGYMRRAERSWKKLFFRNNKVGKVGGVNMRAMKERVARPWCICGELVAFQGGRASHFEY
ncbi:predicted protein [Sclerotinia sclerotiorum 1980 UF-70]|uniref:Uncharacterized protein n=1 Tax=Sclerotinia sclerotiorum (strain ATCC 18683 / 1980 / Ss-1) TaxID=665079 RepID=A7EVS7_SCLS1|nr:predicted protein [Sclerotinia sclerotiorum 1980 UF-70]EDN93569.1 predicted protein [Sclerotinia sclerotiorum 1980 UF-70]